jgi:hypothetical protein
LRKASRSPIASSEYRLIARFLAGGTVCIAFFSLIAWLLGEGTLSAFFCFFLFALPGLMAGAIVQVAIRRMENES